MAYDDPEDPPQASPRGDASNLPADGSIWAAARASYVEDGLSCPVVAERHGLKHRTVRDHALKEDWRGLRAAKLALERRRAELEPDDPAEALLADQRAASRLELLMAPSVGGSLKYIALLMQDALARGAPGEARKWQGLFADVQRNAEPLQRAFEGGVDANEKARIAYYRRIFDFDPATPEADAPDD